MSTTLDTLDWQSHEILRTLVEHDEQLTTTQIRETTPIDDNRKILYRLEKKLLPADLVTAEQPTTTGATIAPKQIALTDAGRDLAQQVADARDDETTIDDLPAQLEQITATLDSIDQRLTAVEEHHTAEQISQHQEQVAALATTVAAVDEHPHGAWDKQEATEYEMIRAGMLALRDIVMDELDYSQDDIREVIQGHEREQE